MRPPCSALASMGSMMSLEPVRPHRPRRQSQQQPAQQRHEHQPLTRNANAFAQIVIAGNAEIEHMQPGDSFAQEIDQGTDGAAHHGTEKNLARFGVAQVTLQRRHPPTGRARKHTIDAPRHLNLGPRARTALKLNGGCRSPKLARRSRRSTGPARGHRLSPTEPWRPYWPASTFADRAGIAVAGARACRSRPSSCPHRRLRRKRPAHWLRPARCRP